MRRIEARSQESTQLFRKHLGTNQPEPVQPSRALNSKSNLIKIVIKSFENHNKQYLFLITRNNSKIRIISGTTRGMRNVTAIEIETQLRLKQSLLKQTATPMLLET